MPTYVYHCDSCGKQFEQFQSFKDAPLTECPCGHQGSVRRVFQPVGIVFKGSGWYINDSRGSNSSSVANAASDSSKGDKADSSSSSSDKAEKPAKADAAKPAAAAKPAE
jgi:putative FmdB family regulatory protein